MRRTNSPSGSHRVTVEASRTILLATSASLQVSELASQVTRLKTAERTEPVENTAAKVDYRNDVSHRPYEDKQLFWQSAPKEPLAMSPTFPRIMPA